MAIFAQVAVEYGVVASGKGNTTSTIGEALERITNMVPVEYLAVGAGVLLLIYLIRR